MGANAHGVTVQEGKEGSRQQAAGSRQQAADYAYFVFNQLPNDMIWNDLISYLVHPDDLTNEQSAGH